MVARVAEESYPESGAKCNTESLYMVDPPVFWGRSRSITLKKRRCEISGVERCNCVLVTSTSALRWKRHVARLRSGRTHQMVERAVLYMM